MAAACRSKKKFGSVQFFSESGSKSHEAEYICKCVQNESKPMPYENFLKRKVFSRSVKKSTAARFRYNYV